VRKIQPEDRPSRFTDLPLISGYENETRAIHTLMSKHDWRDALARLRDLAVRVETVEVELLLAEVYLDADPLANSQLAETELRHAEQGGPTVDQQRRLIDLRARLEKAKRSAM
jgi:hypothetical protein